MNGLVGRLRGGIEIFPATADANARRLVAARGLRALADGYVSILLPAYLLALGLDSFEVGVLATATLLGSASLTLCVGFITSRFGHRAPLLAAAGLMIATGCAFAGVQGFWPLLLVAVIGTLNPSSGDVSVFLPLEHSLLAQSVGDRDRTALYVRYSLAGSLMGAAGTLFAVLPALAVEWWDASPVRVMQGLFLLYAVIGLASGLIYRRIEEPRVLHDAKPSAPLGPSRPIVYRLAALFCVDSFGGGLLVQSMLALWLFQTFGLSVAAAANLFFWTNLASAASMFAAVPLANRIGLVRTMVFTPSAVEPVPDRHPVRAELAGGRWPARAAQPAVANGRADAQLLRHGGRHAGRARRRRERDLRAAQPRFGSRSDDRRLSVPALGVRLAVADRRDPENVLRSGIARPVQPRPAARGASGGLAVALERRALGDLALGSILHHALEAGCATVRVAIVLGQRASVGLVPGMSDHDRRAFALDLLQIRGPVRAFGACTDGQHHEQACNGARRALQHR